MLIQDLGCLGKYAFFSPYQREALQRIEEYAQLPREMPPHSFPGHLSWLLRLEGVEHLPESPEVPCVLLLRLLGG